jgi:bacterioferritin
MTPNPEVIVALQAAASREAHLNLQCRLDQRVLKAWGIRKTAKHLKELGDDAHCFLKKVTDRILFFQSDPGYSIQPVVQPPTLTAMMQNVMALELAIIGPYEGAVQISMKALDDTTRNLFEHLLKWHEENVLWLQTQLNLIDGIGEAEYIAEKL